MHMYCTYIFCKLLYHYVLEMQQYIDISPYRDTLGSDTILIYIYVGHIDLSNIVIY